MELLDQADQATPSLPEEANLWLGRQVSLGRASTEEPRREAAPAWPDDPECKRPGAAGEGGGPGRHCPPGTAAEAATAAELLAARPAAGPAAPRATGAPGPQAEEAPAPKLQLREEERGPLRALQQELGEELLRATRATLVPGETLESCLLRFLRRHGARSRIAAKALRAHLAWREAVRPSALAEQRPEEIAGCPAALLERYMPTWHQGFDREGRPVVFSHYGKFRFRPILEAGVTVEKILQLHVRNSELTARLCGRQSQKLGRDISAAFIIMDTEGWDPQNVRTMAAFDWARGLAKIDQEHYAERMGQLFILNAPPTVEYFYKSLAWALPEKCRSRVQIFAGREHWVPALLQLIDARELPPEYGGSGISLNLASE